MNEKLEALKKAWEEFKQDADHISAEQMKDFENALTQMDAAEVPIKRKKVLDLYA